MNFCLELPDDVLERYAMGTLSGPDFIPLEEHLLVCTTCQSRLAALEDFVQVIRSALAALALHPVARISAQHALSL